jgi:hypothetical protein
MRQSHNCHAINILLQYKQVDSVRNRTIVFTFSHFHAKLNPITSQTD